MNNTTPILYLGDNAANKQFRSILHFDTTSLPDKSIIIAATLKIKQAGPPIGTNPFTILGTLSFDTSALFFGTANDLELADFQFSSGNIAIGSFATSPSVGSWYNVSFNDVQKKKINRTAATEFRLRFTTDDNNNSIADFIRFYSGNEATITNRPTLVVQYYIE